MSFTEAISSGFRKYALFNGRSSRSEYWWWALFVAIGYFALLVLAGFGVNPKSGMNPIFVVPLVLWILALIVPALAISVRRLHDRDKSGWWLLISFIPIVGGIGSIILLIWYLGRGTEGPNRFGDNPLQA